MVPNPQVQIFTGFIYSFYRIELIQLNQFLTQMAFDNITILLLYLHWSYAIHH